MALDPKVKERWAEIQKKAPHPVNAIGVKIDPQKDAMMFKVWKDEGIDKFVKK